MDRKRFLNILNRYKETVCGEELEMIQDFSDFVQKNENCFFREKKEDAKHIGTSVLLLTQDLSKALFMWHAKIKCWTQPGGHADGEEDLHKVALKELEEETGIKGAHFVKEAPIDVYKFVYEASVFGYKKSIFNTWFAATIPAGQEARIMEPTKCLELRWATPAEAREMLQETPDVRTEVLISKWERLILEKYESEEPAGSSLEGC